MGKPPSVLLLDDGELDDIQQLLQELEIPFARVRGSAIVRGTPAPLDLLVSTPRRIDAVVETLEGAEKPPIRVMVVQEDSNALRQRLRREGFDYLVRRPVHSEALRLLLLHCVYKGEERRRERRVSDGREVSFRSGLLSRRATLLDLSVGGCRLLSRNRVEAGRRVRVQVPELSDLVETLQLRGRVVRAEPAPGDGAEGWVLGVTFEPVDEPVQRALEDLVEDRTLGPATLRVGSDVLSRPHPKPAAEPPVAEPEEVPARAPSRQRDRRPRLRGLREINAARDLTGRSGAGAPAPSGIDVHYAIESETRDGEDGGRAPTGAAPDGPGADRRRAARSRYARKIPAFGNRALRVLVGRDLSVGGMRVAHLADVEVGDRLHLAVYGEAGSEPLLVWGTVVRDDGEAGMAVAFDPLDAASGSRLERLVSDLPAVESLHDSEVEAMGTVVSEIVA